MEEKLGKLILIHSKFKSHNVYVDIESLGNIETLEVAIRNKETHEFVETRAISLNSLNKNKIDELIEFIKSYEEK